MSAERAVSALTKRKISVRRETPFRISTFTIGGGFGLVIARTRPRANDSAPVAPVDAPRKLIARDDAFIVAAGETATR